MLDIGVADGVHRACEAHTNWYVVQDGDALTVVDAGFPRSWGTLQQLLSRLGRRRADVEAVVLTHAHFDHVGFAERARRELGVPVWAHEDERSLAGSPWSYDHERSRLPYARHPHFARVFTEMGIRGALWVKGVEEARPFSDGDELDVPGRPRVVATPGHTHGHCALHLPGRGVLLAGDAFVMRDPYTGRDGPCVVAGAATADSPQALRALGALAGLDAEIALTGHGEPWRGAMAEAVARAREAGPA